MIANRGEWMGEIPVSKNLCRKKGWKFMDFNFSGDVTVQYYDAQNALAGGE